jgi:hypothetical protein
VCLQVILTDIKESIGVAASDVMKQACEHNTDVKAEFNAIRAAIMSGHEEVSNLNLLWYLTRTKHCA